jgi:hypothetical protein
MKRFLMAVMVMAVLCLPALGTNPTENGGDGTDVDVVVKDNRGNFNSGDFNGNTGSIHHNNIGDGAGETTTNIGGKGGKGGDGGDATAIVGDVKATAKVGDTTATVGDVSNKQKQDQKQSQSQKTKQANKQEVNIVNEDRMQGTEVRLPGAAQIPREKPFYWRQTLRFGKNKVEWCNAEFAAALKPDKFLGFGGYEWTKGYTVIDTIHVPKADYPTIMIYDVKTAPKYLRKMEPVGTITVSADQKLKGKANEETTRLTAGVIAKDYGNVLVVDTGLNPWVKSRSMGGGATSSFGMNNAADALTGMLSGFDGKSGVFGCPGVTGKIYQVDTTQ